MTLNPYACDDCARSTSGRCPRHGSTTLVMPMAAAALPPPLCPDCGHEPHGAATVTPPSFDVRCPAMAGSSGGPMPEPVYCEHVDWGEVVEAVHACAAALLDDEPRELRRRIGG